MPTTVSYSFTNIRAEYTARGALSTTDERDPSLTALSNGGFYLAYDGYNGSASVYAISSSAYTSAGDTAEPTYNTGGQTNVRGDTAVTQLSNGSILLTWTQSTGTDPGIRHSIRAANGDLIANGALLPGTTSISFASDVVALRDGRFAVVKQDTFASSDEDADLLIYNANGTLATAIALNTNSSSDERQPSVTVLNNGNIAVVYEREKTNGSGAYGMALEIYRQDGTRVLGSTPFDITGDYNLRPDVVALRDGGFAVAYEDGNPDDLQISIAFFTADGALRGTRRADNGTSDDRDPSITVLANGNVVVTWTDTSNGSTDNDIRSAIFDPTTMTRLSINTLEGQAGNQTQSATVGLRNGTFVTAWTDANATGTDGNTDNGGNTHLAVQIDAYVRNTVGTSADEVFRGDAMVDRFFGVGGTDRFIYGLGGNADQITGFDAGAANADVITLSGFANFHSFTDVALNTTQVGANTVINLGGDDVLTLVNVTRTSLTADDFSFLTFDSNVSLAVNSFGTNAAAGGWTSQNATPRTMADVNGDGRADIVGFGASATYVALNNGAGGFANPIVGINSFGSDTSAGGWTSDNQYHRELADVNGDGRADIIGFGSSSTFVALANPNGTFASPFAAINSFGFAPAGGGWATQDQFPRHAADVNGDGRADLVGFGGAGVYVSLANANGTFGAPALRLGSFGADAAAGGWTTDNQYHRELADVNGDGRADIVGFGSSATFVSLATSDGNFANPIVGISSFGFAPAGGGWSTQDQFPRHLGDVNGDGRADIVGFGAASTYIAYGNANGTFTNPFADLASFGNDASAGGWANNNSFPRLLADIDGGGAADILGFGTSGVYVSHSNVDWFV